MLKSYSYERACDRSSHERPDLQHFDADKGIKCFLKLSGDLAIIHQMYSNAVLKTNGFDPFLCKSFLFLGQRQGVDFTAERLGSLISH
jgi:hypothetical protein